MEIEIIEKEPYVIYSHWFAGFVRYADVFWKGPDGVERPLLSRLVGIEEGTRHDCHVDIRIREDLEKVEAFRSQLSDNVGRWLDRNSTWPYHMKETVGMDPLEFVAFVRGRGWSFTGTTSLVVDGDGACHFSGNLNEYSCAFSYEVFSEDLALALIDAVPDVDVTRLESVQAA